MQTSTKGKYIITLIDGSKEEYSYSDTEGYAWALTNSMGRVRANSDNIKSYVHQEVTDLSRLIVVYE